MAQGKGSGNSVLCEEPACHRKMTCLFFSSMLSLTLNSFDTCASLIILKSVFLTVLCIALQRYSPELSPCDK